MVYPFVSQYWNSLVQSRAVTNYEKMLSKEDNVDYNDMFVDADKYNQELLKLEFPFVQYEKIKGYSDLLDINNGMMGYITIDKIGVKIPIYHGTSSAILNIGVGHLEGSSLPVGGDSTHSVLSAHSGLPSSKLFTNLKKLEIGDRFVITVIDRELIYQVDNIVIVAPNDVSNLGIVTGSDYVTLLTCTPYGLNTHRLLVRGIRIDNNSESVLDDELVIINEAKVINKLVVAFAFSIFIFMMLIVYMIIRFIKREIY